MMTSSKQRKFTVNSLLKNIKGVSVAKLKSVSLYIAGVLPLEYNLCMSQSSQYRPMVGGNDI